MKITCPACAADYNVPDTLASGRTVRCAKCATEWTPVPTPAMAVEPPPVAVPEPELAAPPPPAESPPRLAPPPPPALRRPVGLLFAWVGSIAVIAAALVAAFLFRGPVMHAWPPSQRVYGALGLHDTSLPDVHGDVVK